MRKGIRDRLEALRKPAIALVDAKGSSRSWLGGLPKAAATFGWPMDEDQPLCFVGQIALEDLPDVPTPLRLPKQGYLLFFGGPFAECKVHFEPDAAALVEIHPPPKAPVKPATGLRKLLGMAPKDDSINPVFIRKDIGFNVFTNFPPPDSKPIEELEREFEDEKVADEIADMSENLYRGVPVHHFFGYPEPIHGNTMELECEAWIQGVELRYQKKGLSPELKQLEAAATEWKLLLQIDSDHDTGFEWGDVGRLYFWMKPQDAVVRAFDKVQLTSQCY